MKRKLIAMSVGCILTLSACGSNNASNGNEHEFDGTWELIDEDVSSDTTCPSTIEFVGKDEMVWTGVNDNEEKTIDLKYTRVFEDEFKVKNINDEAEENNLKMIRDDDRLRLEPQGEYQGESCTYSLK